MVGGTSSAFFYPCEGAIDAAAMDRDAEAFAHQLDQLGGGQLRLFALRRLQRLDHFVAELVGLQIPGAFDRDSYGT